MGLRLDANHAAVRVLDDQARDARVVGLGEAAHFVHEFNVLRAQLVGVLVVRHGFTHLALEVGHDEAPAMAAWLRSTDRDEAALRASVGPLTFMLYGTFLLELAAHLGPRCEGLAVLGVDLPNSLRPEASLGPLSNLLAELDPDGAAIADDARRRGGGVGGGSAAASAVAWMGLPESERDAIGVAVAGLRARVNALRPLYEERASPEKAEVAQQLADAAGVTDLMLRAMADLFSGRGREADTSLRERFVADQVMASLDALPATARIAYVAHNNHIQKTPVIFDGSLVALPAGLYLRRALGNGYAAIGATHLDDHVPEMEVTGSGPLGFDVVRVPVAPPAPDSVEATAAAGDGGGPAVVALSSQHIPPGGPMPLSIRSQSAVAHAPLGEAFDAVLVVRTATTDARIG